MYVIILSGIPTSGKSTWAKRFQEFNPKVEIISKDIIRDHYFDKPYLYHSSTEERVDEIFEEEVNKAISKGKSMILDNTHCKLSILIPLVLKFKLDGRYNIYLKFFRISKWKAYYRNIKRNLLTGKWVPKFYIDVMYRNLNKIDVQKSSTLRDVKII